MGGGTLGDAQESLLVLLGDPYGMQPETEVFCVQGQSPPLCTTALDQRWIIYIVWGYGAGGELMVLEIWGFF